MTIKNWQTPKVIFQPRVHLGMQRGINQLVHSIRPTLGPVPRLVVVEPALGRDKRPELLDSGGLIARRMTQLADRDEDAGAMLLRHMLWELHEKAGDGTATAAVIFQSVFNQGVSFVTAGGDPVRLRFYLERASQLIVDQLEGMKAFIRGKEQLTRLAETLCYDAELARALGEIYGTLGLFAHLDIRPGRSRGLEPEFFQGAYWEGGLLSRLMADDTGQCSARMANAAIVLSDLEIDEPTELIPLLEVVARSGLRALLVVANRISERALSLLVAPPVREKLQVLAVKTPGRTIGDQWAALQDLSMLTGARPLFKAAGDRMSGIKPEFLGQAGQVYADLEQFGTVVGHTRSDQLELHIGRLREAYAGAETAQARRKLVERIGKLQGGSAVLWVGAPTALAIEARKEMACRASEALHRAMRSGVVPGGGAAYLDCCPTLSAGLQRAESIEEAMAYRILIKALHEPMRALLSNAGVPAGETIGQVERAGRGYGFDVVHNQVADMAAAGIYDSAAVAKAVVSCAVRGAALALTTQVLVHRRNPPDASHAT